IEKWRAKSFICLDGEGEDTPEVCNEAGDKKHIYTMLTAVGQSVERILYRDGQPLSTWEIFDWLLDLSRSYCRYWFVMFSFNYDVNKWLCDLHIETLKLLNERGSVKVLNRANDNFYEIKFIPGKLFDLREQNRSGKILRSVTVYDAFG